MLEPYLCFDSLELRPHFCLNSLGVRKADSSMFSTALIIETFHVSDRMFSAIFSLVSVAPSCRTKHSNSRSQACEEGDPSLSLSALAIGAHWRALKWELKNVREDISLETTSGVLLGWGKRMKYPALSVETWWRDQVRTLTCAGHDVWRCVELFLNSLMSNGKELWLQLPLPGGRGKRLPGNELPLLWLCPYHYLDLNAWVWAGNHRKGGQWVRRGGTWKTEKVSPSCTPGCNPD